MKKKFIILCFLITYFFIIPMENKEEDKEIDLFLGLGVEYNFLASTNSTYKQKFLFLQIPFSTEIELKIKQELSLGSGINFSYGITSYQKEVAEDYYKYYNHNFFIDIPFHIKFYPLVNINQIYERFYLGTSLFIHFWLLNYYYIQNLRNNKVTSGNGFTSSIKEMPPTGVYTPVNLGIILRIGNQFKISEKNVIGVELYGSYLFLPVINGFYNSINYKEENIVILEFVPSIGINLFLGFILF